jgi:hypothetical protein
MKKYILAIAILALTVVACKKKTTPGASTTALGVNYKTNGTVDTVTYALDSMVNFSFGKITLNLDSLSKTVYGTSATPTSSLINSISVECPDYTYDEFLENDMNIYISNDGASEKLFATMAIAADHVMKFTPVSGINLSDYIGTGKVMIRARAELQDGVDITETIPLILSMDTKYVFPK